MKPPVPGRRRRPAPPPPTIAQRLASLTASLTGPMADGDWAADLARRIVYYDPLAEMYDGIRFMPGDRIIVSYRATGETRALTYVVPRWTPPKTN